MRSLGNGKRVHHRVLPDLVKQLLNDSDHPLVIIETGCIRNLNEGTDSTLLISSVLKDSGQFYTFELEPDHIEICKELCGENNAYINYVQGDSVTNLREYVRSGKLEKIDLAFLDSVNDGDHIWKEFKEVEAQIQPGGYVVVDDVLWADKGRVILPFLEQSPDWETEVYNYENGMVVARRL